MSKPLGAQAKDKVTGFEGIIVGRTEWLFGCDQYGLTPKAKDGKVEDTQYFDDGRIEITGEGVTVDKLNDDPKLTLGERAIDTVTGFEGILIGRLVHISSYDQYGLAPKVKEGKVEETRWFDYGRIKVLGKALRPEDVQVEKTGGPQRDCPTHIR